MTSFTKSYKRLLDWFTTCNGAYDWLVSPSCCCWNLVMSADSILGLTLTDLRYLRLAWGSESQLPVSRLSSPPRRGGRGGVPHLVTVRTHGSCVHYIEHVQAYDYLTRRLGITLRLLFHTFHHQQLLHWYLLQYHWCLHNHHHYLTVYFESYDS